MKHEARASSGKKVLFLNGFLDVLVAMVVAACLLVLVVAVFALVAPALLCCRLGKPEGCLVFVCMPKPARPSAFNM